MHTHTQETPAQVWTINHGLGTYPVVDAYVEHGGVVQKILPSSVVYVDGNVCTVSFAVPRAGFATVV